MPAGKRQQWTPFVIDLPRRSRSIKKLASQRNERLVSRLQRIKQEQLDYEEWYEEGNSAGIFPKSALSDESANSNGRAAAVAKQDQPGEAELTASQPAGEAAGTFSDLPAKADIDGTKRMFDIPWTSLLALV